MKDKRDTSDLKGFKVTSDKKSETKLVEHFLDTINIHNISSVREQIMLLVHQVAQIPWGEGRTIEEVLRDTKSGTCTGKHRVLEMALDLLQIEYQSVVCTFKWSQQGIQFPERLENILNDGTEWEHGHNFVRLKMPSSESGIEEWIDVDVNWDPELGKYGFITVPEDWEGTSIVAVKNIIRRWENTSIGDMKIQLIEELSSEQRSRRKEFLGMLMEWIKSIRKNCDDNR